jgi:hypothetical protein
MDNLHINPMLENLIVSALSLLDIKGKDENVSMAISMVKIAFSPTNVATCLSPDQLFNAAVSQLQMQDCRDS